MASEEERAKIVAEYMAAGKNNDEDEDEDEEEEEDFEEDEEAIDGAADFPVLQGRFKIDEESRLVYLGFWCMRKQLGTKSSNNYNFETNNTKFKLRSIQKISWGKNLHKPPSETPIRMDGFFLTDATDKIRPHRKIKERGVEIRFIKSRNIPKRYLVKGQGENDFGHFRLSGIYSTGKNSNPKHKMECNKQYASANREDDGDYDTDDGADDEELDGLADEANMSIEELRAKYYGGNGDANGDAKDKNNSSNNDDDADTKPPAAKKPKLQPAPQDDDDEEECGF